MLSSVIWILTVFAAKGLWAPVLCVTLYPFGHDVYDYQLPRGGNHYKNDLVGTYNFHGTSYTSGVKVMGQGGYLLFDGDPRRTDFPFDGAAIIAVFWSDIDTFFNDIGDVWVREAHSGFDPTTLVIATDDVHKYFPCADDFAATHVLVCTWEDILPYISFYYYDFYFTYYEIFGTNTFQVVMSTDGNETFVFLLYERIGWTWSTTSTREDYEAAVGLSAGDGVHYWLHPNSGTTGLRYLEETSNVCRQGVWALKVDGDEELEPHDETLCNYTCAPQFYSPILEMTCIRCKGARGSEEVCNNQKTPNFTTCRGYQVCGTDVRCDGRGRLSFIKGCKKRQQNAQLNTLLCNEEMTRCGYLCNADHLCNEHAPPEVWESLVCADE